MNYQAVYTNLQSKRVTSQIATEVMFIEIFMVHTWLEPTTKAASYCSIKH